MRNKLLRFLPLLISTTILASCASSKPKIDLQSLTDRERDGFTGNVKAVLTDDVILTEENGQWLDAQQASSTAIYDSAGKRTLQTPFRVNLNGGFAITPHELLFDPATKSDDGNFVSFDKVGKKYVEYDSRGNVIEKGSQDNGQRTGKEMSVQYEFDSHGNWTKRTISRLTEKGGQKILLPAEISYRQIVYADSTKSSDGFSAEQIPASAKLLGSPVAATEETITAGQLLYMQKCVACHGTDGKSQTEFAAVMPTRPADLTAPKTAELTEGQIYSITGSGIRSSGMPAFKGRISDDAIWKIALYVRQLTSGKAAETLAAKASPTPSKPVPPGADRRYKLTGKIVSVERELEQVTIEHEDIEGYMGAMTMPFPLKDKKLLGTAKKGDRIRATLVIAGNGGWRLENVIIN